MNSMDTRITNSGPLAEGEGWAVAAFSKAMGAGGAALYSVMRKMLYCDISAKKRAHQAITSFWCRIIGHPRFNVANDGAGRFRRAATPRRGLLEPALKSQFEGNRGAAWNAYL